MHKSILFVILVVALLGSFVSVVSAVGYTYELNSNYDEDNFSNPPWGTVIEYFLDHRQLFLFKNIGDTVEAIQAFQPRGI